LGGTAATAATPAVTTPATGGGLLSSLAANPLTPILAGIGAAPLLGPTVTGALRSVLDTFGVTDPTAPSVRDWINAYESGKGIPDFGYSAEDVKKILNGQSNIYSDKLGRYLTGYEAKKQSLTTDVLSNYVPELNQPEGTTKGAFNDAPQAIQSAVSDYVTSTPDKMTLGDWTSGDRVDFTSLYEQFNRAKEVMEQGGDSGPYKELYRQIYGDKAYKQKFEPMF
jgi:hypothetical protein